MIDTCRWTLSSVPVALSMLVLAAALQAGVIRVGPAGDFTEIQPAIDAAKDGDVILVEPVGAYATFDLTKGVVVRSAARGQRFVVQVDNVQPYVLVANTAPPQHAGIEGMEVLGVSFHSPETGFLLVRDCAGEVVLEDILIERDLGDGQRLLVERSANVAVAGLRAVAGLSFESETAVSIRSASRVRIDGSFIKAGDACNWGAETGIQVFDSMLVLSSTDVLGGNGADCQPALFCGPGLGGAAIRATDAEVVILGTDAHRIRGGDGGSGLTGGCDFPGGNGGAGFVGDAALVSLVQVVGGTGGAGNPPGTDAPAWSGILARDDRMPRLSAPLDLHLGDAFDLVLDTVDPGSAVLFVATATGFLVNRLVVGPPLSTVPGGVFLVLPIGHADANGTRVLPVAIPDDPLLVGFRMHLQMAIVGDGAIYHTNAISRILGE